jgi:hypothetical protein
MDVKATFLSRGFVEVKMCGLEVWVGGLSYTRRLEELETERKEVREADKKAIDKQIEEIKEKKKLSKVHYVS